MLLNVSETPNETFSRFCTRQKHQMKLFHASAHDRNTKWNFFVLLHASETPNKTFSRFCTRQKHQIKLFRASAHDRNAIRRKEYALVRVGRTGFIIINQLLFIIQTFILLRYKVCGPPANHFLKGLAFPRSAKVVSRMVWSFRAWRKSFPEWFGVSAHGESHFPNGLTLAGLPQITF